jgi:hypothetical protein
LYIVTFDTTWPHHVLKTVEFNILQIKKKKLKKERKKEREVHISLFFSLRLSKTRSYAWRLCYGAQHRCGLRS